MVASRYLCSQGPPEPQRGRAVNVRPSTCVQLNGDVFRFMKSLGYSYSFEIVRKGYLIAYERHIKITITQLYKVWKNDSERIVDLVFFFFVAENEGGYFLGGPCTKSGLMGDRGDLYTGDSGASQSNGGTAYQI